MSLSKQVIGLLEKLFPWLLVHYDIDGLFMNQPAKAADIVMKKLDEESILDQKYVMVVIDDFNANKMKLLSAINSLQEPELNEYIDLFLFKAVATFESAINHWFNQELRFIYEFSHKQSNNILAKLSNQDKLDWLLKMMTGDSFTEQNSWSTIKQMIKMRNTFIHFKPTDFRDFNVIKGNLTKESILRFIDAITECHYFLEERTCKEVTEYDQRLQFITEYYKACRRA
ncbi:hypothetical protein [Sporosarcina highlanderae]|uniref:Apea-like HEPN domain-containing protein n=1 Tax=Sporosarcina highlanderae TaxID=3035916 RepID=A0ABT8JVG9_9BACL|nr:hypothetical protein [Sporosarcina highlanderae]MDN4609168.1 hypothetical protein [Sporosarcina highlanderae]